MLLVLTGGIATGKSTFRRMLAERRRFTQFDADACVHELLSNNRTVIESIRAVFGPRAIGPGSDVDRAVLRDIVFSDASARRELEAIVHPRVRQAWLALRSECLDKGADFLADIPLLFETGAAGFFDASIVVASSPGVQRERMASRGLDSGTAQAMLASQLPLEEKVARATVSVWNDGSLGALNREADLLLARLFPPDCIK